MDTESYSIGRLTSVSTTNKGVCVIEGRFSPSNVAMILHVPPKLIQVYISFFTLMKEGSASIHPLCIHKAQLESTYLYLWTDQG